MTRSLSRSHSADRLAPGLTSALCHCLALSVTLVLLLPAARGSHALIGWLPLWLLGMPLSALVVLHLSPDRWVATSAQRRAPQQAHRSRPATHRQPRPAKTVRPARAPSSARLAAAA